ncbi:MAG: rhomboid family intramembrane serine protease [Candidatus Latescibacteria bacterium]|nr:rhomboid family intramembrane serine protease [Candidatus Latescibacterota bacterium]
MIPLKDDIPTRSFPLVTILFILTNVSVFLYQFSLGDMGNAVFTMGLGVIPFEITHFADAVSPTPIPLYLTLITSMFLHGGLVHLGGNMLYLWIFGNNIEDILGHVRFFFFYLLCGVLATLTFIVSAPDSRIPLVGASGAIAGVLGAYMIRFPGARVLVLFWFLIFVRVIYVPALVVLGFWFLIQVLNASADAGAQGGVAWFAHIGGFIAGILLIRRYRRKRDVTTVYRL